MGRTSLLVVAIIASTPFTMGGYGAPSPSPVLDARNMANGKVMLVDQYLDQPFCVIWSGAAPEPEEGEGYLRGEAAHLQSPTAPSVSRWICTITRNSKPEGSSGEHVQVLTSEDQGSTWQNVQDIENQTGVAQPLTNAYSTIVQTSYGRVYVLYNMNVDNVTLLPSGQRIARDDELGQMAFRYSDDGGITWSTSRYLVSIRETSIDFNNTWAGKVRLFWNVDQMKVASDGQTVLFAFTKIGTYPQDAPEEIWLLSSSNILTERNASKIQWNTLPSGSTGLTPPGGNPNIAEEGHVVPFFGSPGLFVIFRTTQGYLACASTADPSGGAGWTQSHFATYWNANPSANGSPLKNPRGPTLLKRFSNGRYLLLFYFSSYTSYTNRDPYWIASGREENGEIRFSQPEIALYDYLNTQDRPGYPDFVEDNGAVYITETNKTVARVHQISQNLLKLLFLQDTIKGVPTDAAITFDARSQGEQFVAPLIAPFLPYSAGAGVSFAFWVRNAVNVAPGQIIISTQAKPMLSSGVYFQTAANGSFSIAACDASNRTVACGIQRMDDSCARLLQSDNDHLVGLVIDGGAHIITWFVDGKLCDGGSAPAGWSFFTARVVSLQGAQSFVLAPNYTGQITGGWWYSRVLTTSELVGIFREGTPG